MANSVSTMGTVSMMRTVAVAEFALTPQKVLVFPILPTATATTNPDLVTPLSDSRRREPSAAASAPEPGARPHARAVGGFAHAHDRTGEFRASGPPGLALPGGEGT
eukprot:CAMPEP_0206234988 /NCGR_PEP_ID=MMETSP0047_2-20121206/12898_1 /ASSEMBLY_ACC=CAM_ASM_000192 /TAXON_ID=195065 /ORGANISM="Chroomonas mesostigmatica_cf, Strain CCMP1168" /LENGTH=105 /DNA_ID=CAMNT_0053659139 /DNA_START=548 /DNA_END=863 /DNA_ORIENTATION=+